MAAQILQMTQHSTAGRGDGPNRFASTGRDVGNLLKNFTFEIDDHSLDEALPNFKINSFPSLLP